MTLSVLTNWYTYVKRGQGGYCISCRKVKDIMEEISRLKLYKYDRENVWIGGLVSKDEGFLFILRPSKDLEVWKVF